MNKGTEISNTCHPQPAEALCLGLSMKYYHGFICLNSWSPVGCTAWGMAVGPLKDVAVLAKEGQ